MRVRNLMVVLRLVFSSFSLGLVLLGLWFLNVSLFIARNVDQEHRRSSINIPLEGRHRRNIENEIEAPEVCKSPYGPNIGYNIRYILLKNKISPENKIGEDLINASSDTTWNSTSDTGQSDMNEAILKFLRSHERIVSHQYNASILPVSSSEEQRRVPVIVTAASSNHFKEVQALLYNLHTEADPHHTMKIVFFDLGLEKQQHIQMVRHCACDVRIFPFWKYPSHVKDLSVYAWKPIILQMTMEEFGFIMYMDASVRLRKENMVGIFALALEHGIMTIPGEDKSYTVVEHTDPRTFAFLGERPCYFGGLLERQAGFMLLSAKSVILRVLLQPWVECALTLECIAPQGSKRKWLCSYFRHFYGECHRYDQSVLNILLWRIYSHESSMPTIPHKFYKIDRIDRMDYFDTF